MEVMGVRLGMNRVFVHDHLQIANNYAGLFDELIKSTTSDKLELITTDSVAFIFAFASGGHGGRLGPRLTYTVDN